MVRKYLTRKYHNEFFMPLIFLAGGVMVAIVILRYYVPNVLSEYWYVPFGVLCFLPLLAIVEGIREA